MSFVLVLAATATSYAQGAPASDAPAEPGAPTPGEPGTGAPAPTPPQGLPAYPENPRFYAPPPAPAADPGRITIDTGANVTGTGSGWIHGAWMLEGGFTIPKLVPAPYFVRARAALMLTGGTIQSDWSGTYTRYAVGGEAGVCGSFVCGFADLDIAYQHADLHDDSDRLVGDRKGPHLYGRAGIDLGPRRIHVRAAIEVGRWKTHHTPSQWRGTGGFFLGLGVRL